MVLRHRNYQHLRSAVTLGTGLTALFLFVRCSVPERDYADLGIGQNAGSGGQSGGDGNGAGSAGLGGLNGLGGVAGQDGLGDAGGMGGQGGAPPVPVPCVLISNDAGVSDAGSEDAGSEDAGSEDAGAAPNPYGVDCECVDGFIRAIDADGDGDRSRVCAVAPGLDCDDGDGAVTHNSCGGCTALPNTVGEDCLDCGAYTCDGPESVVCATKQNPVVVDPDCRCVDALIVARDTDNDGAGTRLCEQSPGIDCNDGDNSFTTNQCGGCAELPGVVGGGCNECGVYTCNGTAMVCAPNPATPRQCLNTTTRQTCINDGFWGSNFTCANACYQGNCETCLPGEYRCIPLGSGSEQLERCVTDASLGSSSYGVGWTSWASCTNNTCNATTGGCTGSLFLPRDETFDVVPRQRGILPWHDVLNTASDSDYG